LREKRIQKSDNTEIKPASINLIASNLSPQWC